MLRDHVKFGRPPSTLERAAVLVERHVSGGRFSGFFGPDVTLIPAPGHAPLVEGAYWSSERVAVALQRAGLAGSVSPVLRREVTVQKSAFAARGQRPTVLQHVMSMEVDLDAAGGLFSPKRVVIVDDFVTKGATLYAAAVRVKAALPDAEVRAFALIRTMGLVPEIDELIDPVEGVLAYTHTTGHIDRRP